MQKKNRQEIVFIGTNHTSKEDSKVIRTIGSEWKKFLNLTKSRKRMALVEGGVILGPFKNTSAAIKRFGEMGYAMHLAQQAGVALESSEPSDAFLVSRLQSRFSREEIQLHRFLTIVPQWKIFKQQYPDFKEYVVPFLRRDAEATGWKDLDFSYQKMLSLHRSILGREFDPESWKASKWFKNGILPFNVVNKIGYQSWIERDAYIANRILTLWEQGYSLFVVWGGLHAVNQENSLRKRL